jgi:hypothetical protein
MMAKQKSQRKLLYNGGEAFLNPIGDAFDIDVFDADYEKGDEPTYHKHYDNFGDAMSDFESWKPWPKADIFGEMHRK